MKSPNFYNTACDKIISVINPENKVSRLVILILFFLYSLSTLSLSGESSSKILHLGKNKNQENDTTEVNKYSRIALKYSSKPDYLQRMKSYIDTAELICKNKNIEMPALLHLARAEYFLVSNDFNSASQEINIAASQSKNEKNYYILALTMDFLGRYNLRTGFFMESISYFENSIEIAKKNKFNGIIPKSYYRLALVYDTSVLSNLKEFRNSLNNVIEAAKSENDTLFLELGYWILGSSLTEKEPDHSKADSLLRKCLEISLIKKDTLFISRSLLNLGWNYYRKKDYGSAIEYYNKSLIYSINAKIYGSSDNAYGNLGTIYRDIRNSEKAIKYYRKSIEQAKLGGDVYALWWINRDMSEMYLREKDTSNAYLSYVEYKKYYDIFISKSNTQGLTNARIRYEAESHNKELELLSLRIRNQRLMIYGSTSLFLLSLAISILIINRSRINSRRRISEMNHKISEITQANLRQQMNPHFIFNTLNSIQYYMYQHDKLATNNYLTKFSSLMRKVLENSQLTSIPLRDELDALTLYLDLEKIRFKDKFDYQINIDEEIDCILYKVPTMLIQPYVENSICHGLMPGESKGLVKIDLELKNDYISCIIEDNGIGREAAQEKKIKSDNNHNSLGTQIATSRLDLVNALYGTSLKTIYTDLNDENGESAGTRVEIQIPLLS